MAGDRARGLPRLHVIVGDGILGRGDVQERLRPLLEAGGRGLALHLRARDTSAARLFEVSCRLAGTANEFGTMVVVNDRLDVALASGATGVHLREDSIPPTVARDIVDVAEARGGRGRPAGRDLAGARAGRFFIGRSIHTPEQAAGRSGSGLDYLVVGAVYPTRSHPGGRSIGTDAVADAVRTADLPVLAIGGIEPETTPVLVSSGVHGVVVLSGVWRAPDPPEAVTRYLEVLPGQRHTEDAT